MSEHGPGAAGTPAAALEPVATPGQAARIAWRWTMAYTQPAAAPRGAGTVPPRTAPRWWSAARRAVAVGARPGLWAANLLFLARHGPAVVAVGDAAACVPNPVRAGRARRVLWPVTGLVLAAALATATLLLGGAATAASAGQPAVAAGLVVLFAAGNGSLVLAVTHLVLDGCGAVPDRLLRRCAAELARSAGRPVVVGTSFGAWPRGTGNGTPLLTAVLAELRADRGSGCWSPPAMTASPAGMPRTAGSRLTRTGPGFSPGHPGQPRVLAATGRRPETPVCEGCSHPGRGCWQAVACHRGPLKVRGRSSG